MKWLCIKKWILFSHVKWIAIIEWSIVLWGLVLRSFYFYSNPKIYSDSLIRFFAYSENSLLDIFKLGSEIKTGVFDPYGILIIQKALVSVFGVSEYSLRLFVFLCGCLSVIVFRKVMNKVVGRYAGMVALTLFALSWWAIRYSVVVNAFASDILVALLLYGLFLRIFASQISVRKVIVWSLCCGLSFWFSLPAVFVVGGGILSLLIASIVEKQNKERLWAYGTLAVISGISFSVYYFVTLRHHVGVAGRLVRWQDHLMPVEQGFFSSVLWSIDHFYQMFINPLGIFPLVGILLVGIGSVRMFKERKLQLMLLLMPFILMLVACGMRQYAFSGRILIFLIPAFYLLIGQGWESLFLRERRGFKPIIAVLLLVFLFYLPVRKSFEYVKFSRYSHEIIHLQKYIKENFKQGDIIYVDHHVRLEHKFYNQLVGLKGRQYIVQDSRSQLPRKDEFEKLAQSKRVWFLSRRNTDLLVGYNLSQLNKLGVCVFKKGDRYRLYLYEIKPSASSVQMD